MYKKNQSGITLAVLIVTIVVMLILTTVVLDLLNDNIMDDAEYTKEMGENVTKNDQQMKDSIRQLYQNNN